MSTGLLHTVEARRISRLIGFTIPSTLLLFFFTFGAPIGSIGASEPVLIRCNGSFLTYYRPPRISHPSEYAFDLYDSFQKDENGNLIVTFLGVNRVSRSIDSLYVGYVLKTKKGRPVIVFQQTPTHSRSQQSNCHGYTFLDGEYWILSSQVEKILDDNGWRPVSEPEVEPGNVAVYRQANGRVYHSARIIGRNATGHLIVNSKNGFGNPQESVPAVEAAFQ